MAALRFLLSDFLTLFHHFSLNLRTLYTVWSLVRHRVTRCLTRPQTMCNVLKYRKILENVALRLWCGCVYFFQFTYNQYCTSLFNAIYKYTNKSAFCQTLKQYNFCTLLHKILYFHNYFNNEYSFV